MLSAIRGLAAMFVVVEHAQPYFAPLSAPMGYLAVDLFFLLSGAVIEASYGERLRAGLGVACFARIRLVRLYPLYFLGIAFMVLAVAAAPGHRRFVNAVFGLGIPAAPSSWLMALLLLPLTHGPNLFPFDPPAWSLFFEIVINLIYAVLAPRLTTRLALAIAAASLALLVPATLGQVQDLFITGMLRAGFSFFLGVVLLRVHWQVDWRPSDAVGRSLMPFVLAGIIVLLSQHESGRTAPVSSLLTVTLGFPVLLWLAMAVRPGPRALPVCRVLGDTSYAVYALHEPLIVLGLSVAVGRFGLPLTALAPLSGLAFLAALITLCGWIDRFYDMPVRRRLSPRPALDDVALTMKLGRYER